MVSRPSGPYKPESDRTARGAMLPADTVPAVPGRLGPPEWTAPSPGVPYCPSVSDRQLGSLPFWCPACHGFHTKYDSTQVVQSQGPA